MYYSKCFPQITYKKDVTNNTVLQIAQTKVTVTELHIVKHQAGEDHTHVGVHSYKHEVFLL